MSEELIGYCGVDAGLIWIGDPCYVIPPDASHAPASWQEFCEATFEQEKDEATGGKYGKYSQPCGDGIGFAVSSGYGDGYYPVFIEYSDEGEWGTRVKSLRIEFIGDEHEDDGEDERYLYDPDNPGEDDE